MGRNNPKQDRKRMSVRKRQGEIRPDKSTGKSNGSKDSAGKGSFRSKAVLLGILIVIVSSIVLAVHWPALSARALSTDDNEYLVKNVLVKNPGWTSAGRFLGEVLNPSTVDGYYQPLSMISLMLDYAMGGRVDNLMPFHRTSLILHIINTILVIGFIFLLFGQPWIAALAGLLFGIHPVTVAPIPWVGERKTVLAAFFALSSLVFYVLYTRKSGRKFYRISFVMYILALMSKPTSTPLPLLMLLLDYWPIKRLNLKSILEKIPYFLIGIISAVITFISQRNTAGAALPGGNSLVRMLLVLCHNIVFYLYKIIWPINLSSHYPFPEPLALSNPTVLAGVTGTCLLIAVLLISLRWTRSLMAGWLFFFISIFPTMGVVGFTNVIASDKYAYLPSVGLLLPLAFVLGQLWKRTAKIQGYAVGRTVIIAIVLILSLSEFTATRNYLFYWQDSELLFRYMLRNAPQSFELHNSLAIILSDRGKLDEAVSHFREAIHINPGYAKGHCNLGTTLARLGKSGEAFQQYYEAIKINPDFAEAYNGIGLELYDQGKPDQAIIEYRKALKIKPFDAGTLNNMGNALVMLGKPDEAVYYYKQSVSADPEQADAYFNLGVVLSNLGKPDEAADCFNRVIRINPNDVEAHNKLEGILKKDKPENR